MVNVFRRIPVVHHLEGVWRMVPVRATDENVFLTANCVQSRHFAGRRFEVAKNNDLVRYVNWSMAGA